MDAGSNGLLPADTFDLDDDGDTSEPLSVDLLGDARVQDGTVNMGSLETVNENTPPVAAWDDWYTVTEDETLDADGDPAGVLENDVDDDGDPLTALLVSDVTHGTLELHEDGTFVYEPDENFNGVDTFTYKAFDGEEESPEATVTITVEPANDAPVFESMADKGIVAGGTLTFTLAASDPLDDPADAITFSAVDLPDGATLDPATGVFTWIPATTQAGSHSITFIATDDGSPALSNEQTVTVTVYDPGVIPSPVLHSEPEETEGWTNTIAWDAVPDAVDYLVQCDDDPDFTSIDAESGWIDETSYLFTDLTIGTTYYYRAKLRSEIGEGVPADSDWSAVEFSTQIQVFESPILYVDADAAGSASGYSWDDAFTDVQAALDLASVLNTDSISQNDISSDMDCRGNLHAHRRWSSRQSPLGFI